MHGRKSRGTGYIEKKLGKFWPIFVIFRLFFGNLYPPMLTQPGSTLLHMCHVVFTFCIWSFMCHHHVCRNMKCMNSPVNSALHELQTCLQIAIFCLFVFLGFSCCFCFLFLKSNEALHFCAIDLPIIEECFSKTHSVHFNPFWDNHVFVFIAI